MWYNYQQEGVGAMKNWHVALVYGVKDALGRCKPCRVVVHTDAQAELGRRAAHRLCLYTQGQDEKHLTFEVIPEQEQDIYPVGAILV